MIELQGKYNIAKVFTDNIDAETISQVINLLNQELSVDSTIRIMPDCHAGAGCVIGTTMTLTDKVVPNLVGVDIGCGMLTVSLGKMNLKRDDLVFINDYIIKNIPHGFNVNEKAQASMEILQNLRCFYDIDRKDFNLAIGSLGGGNHFIEIDENNDGGETFLVIHSGSRNLGLQIANYYQDLAFRYHNGVDADFEQDRNDLISHLRHAGKQAEIQNAIIELRKKHTKQSHIPKDFCYLEGEYMADYLHDMGIAQKYAVMNRYTMAQKIVMWAMSMNFDSLLKFETVHNYINLESKMLRKGAVSAQKAELLLIPINMRDGSLLCRGKGNPDWNFSAPHGAGRLMSRSKAKEDVSLSDFVETMKDVYTTSVGQTTLDESPFAYKPIDEIVENIQDTAEIIARLKPIYNFKSS